MAGKYEQLTTDLNCGHICMLAMRSAFFDNQLRRMNPMKNGKEINPNLMDMVSRICQNYALDEILYALSKHCINRAKEILNKDLASENETRAITWLEFERRILHLAKSCRRKRENYVEERGEYKKVSSEKVYKHRRGIEDID